MSESGKWQYTYPNTVGPVVYEQGDHSAKRTAICEIRKPNSIAGKANAALIAAAPELLRALQDLREAVREYGLLDVKKRFRLCTADAQAGMAIHKATGGDL